MKIKLNNQEISLIKEILDLSEEDYNYMKNINDVPHKYMKNYLKITLDKNDAYIIANESTISQIREVFEDYFSIAGSFDENDEVNEKGKIIESLIDKFHI